MSQSRNGPGPSLDPQPLLPAQVERTLKELAIRLSGGGLVAFAVSGWLALLSWQAPDPAMPNAAKAAARNLLGQFGAGLSDMLLQTLGIAAVFALLCPMVWGMELLANVSWIAKFRRKLAAFLGALLILPAVASGIPAPDGWPLAGGAGGMVGDLMFNFFATSLQRWGLERASTASLLLLASAGLACLAWAVGIKIRHLFSLRRTPARQVSPTLDIPDPLAPTDASGAQAADVGLQAPRAEATARDTRSAAAPAPAGHSPALAAAAAVPMRQPQAFGDLDDGFEDDAETHESARAFAERFAPGVAIEKTEERRRLMPGLATTLARARQPAGWKKPSLNLLRRGRGTVQSNVDVESGAAQLLDVLAAFGVKGEIKEARSGPVVTRYELEPVRGTKISRVIGLSDDFARELGAHAVRVSVTPGRTTIGIEVPNETRDSVMLRDIMESDAFCSNPALLPLALGKGIGGEPVVLDLARMPHLLVAGTTGSGKSVGLNSMLLSLMMRLEPSELRLMMIDPKMLEMAQYDRVPHLLAPVITDPQDAAIALEWAVVEMEERYKRMALAGARNIEAYNARVKSAIEKGQPLLRTVQTGFDDRTGRPVYEQQPLDGEALPFIVIVIDELADLMLSAGKRIETSLQRLAQKARAAGIHLVMATQRPSVDVVTGTIKANFPCRISFRVASKIDSRTILNEPGAEQLLGHGDMLLTAGSGQHLRVHGTYVADEEIERVADHLRGQGEPRYVDLHARPEAPQPPVERSTAKLVTAKVEREAARLAKRDEAAYAEAVAVVLADRKASAGHLHRRLGMPLDAAETAILRMEREGIVSAANLFGRRSIQAVAAKADTRRRKAA